MDKYTIKFFIINKFFIFALFCAFFICGKSASALEQDEKLNAKCSCPPKKSLDEQVAESDLVFVGQVLEVRPKFPLHKGYYYARFLPLKNYKGVNSYPNQENIIIYSPIPASGCSVKFIKGNDYLIFAKGNPAFLKVSNCELTGIQEDRVAEITILENKKRGQ